MSEKDEGVSRAAGNVRPRRERIPKVPDVVWAAAEADYFAGATAREISERYGMAQKTVYARMAGRGKRGRGHNLNAARPEVRPLSGLEVSRIIRGMVGEGFARAAERLLGEPVASGVRRLDDGMQKLFRIFPEATWKQARRDYEAGFTASAISERYDIPQMTVEGRAFREKWNKTVRKEVRPLQPVDDPAQVEIGEDGKPRPKWREVAHAAQLPPSHARNGGPWRTWLFQGGRGAGKTRAGAEWIAELAETTPDGVFAIVGATESDVRRVMIEGPSGLKNLPGRERPRYESSLKKVTWSNGAKALVFSAEEPDRLRGPQFMAAWGDEFGAWRRGAYTLAMLRMGLRVKRPMVNGEALPPQLVITTTPRPIPALRRLHEEGSCAVSLAPSEANAKNLHPDFLEGLGEIYGGTRLERQEVLGELVEGEGTLWRREWIVRGEAPEKLGRVVVAVDPPAGDGVCGIVVAGRVSGERGARAFVLEDASVAGASPSGWGRRATDAARRHGAMKIVVEANQGGEMARAVLAMEDPPCRIEKVHARFSKSARAEPVAALYEKGRVVHCGAFGALEEEMLTLGSDEERRLDRMDALVWALSDLLLSNVARPGMF